MLEFFCKLERGQIPRQKDLLARVASLHPTVGERAIEFFQGSDVATRARLSTEIADATIGARGFCEWDSGAGPVPT
jgi:hypothetical protein